MLIIARERASLSVCSLKARPPLRIRLRDGDLRQCWRAPLCPLQMVRVLRSFEACHAGRFSTNKGALESGTFPQWTMVQWRPDVRTSARRTMSCRQADNVLFDHILFHFCIIILCMFGFWPHFVRRFSIVVLFDVVCHVPTSAYGVVPNSGLTFCVCFWKVDSFS